MSKELEARKTLNKYRNFWYNETDKEKVEVANAVNVLLTYPTQEEVCEALSDYLNCGFFDIKCVFKDNGFHEECGGELIEVLIVCQNVIRFYVNLPPHIVEMVARFYKGIMK